jgi:hypothetical protein
MTLGFEMATQKKSCVGSCVKPKAFTDHRHRGIIHCITIAALINLVDYNARIAALVIQRN